MKHGRIFFFLLALICSVSTQDNPTTAFTTPKWNGDPLVCIPDSSPAPSQPYPVFPTKAEFSLEMVQSVHAQGTNVTILTRFQYLYDQDANQLVMIKNNGTVIDLEYYYYNIPKKSTYYRGETCVVTDIPFDVENDGTSAIHDNNNKPRIRPLNEFLLFSRQDPRKEPITPRFLGQATVRGLVVNQWLTCLVDQANRVTEKRVWSFVAPGQMIPTGLVGNEAVPVQAEISRSFDFPNGSQVIEFDTIFNVHNFRPGIIETTAQLAPPKGVFCSSGPDQVLGSLEDVRIIWPERFSVRIEASSSRSTQWQRFHLRYDRGRFRGGRIIRYDYLPPGSEDYRSIIHDYAQNVTYRIDLRTGGCEIHHSLHLRDVSPIRDPIEFFIKHEDVFILNRRGKIWEFNGYRPCRGDSIECTIITAQYPNFPAIVESDTGRPTGETWTATNMEYAWSIRAPFAPTQNGTKHFDYPAHLYLRFYHNDPNSGPIPTFSRNEDVEYEFFEMSEEGNQWDFDVSTCFRANNYDYLHLGFVLGFTAGAQADGNVLNRRILQREVTRALASTMRIGYPRISGVEIDHETTSNTVTVFFTVLGTTPGVPSSESNVDRAKELLEMAVNNGTFRFSMPISDNSSTEITFAAQANSLKSSKQFMSIHATGSQVVEKSYSKSAEALAIIFGLVIGLIVGIVIAVVVRVMRKEPLPAVPGLNGSFNNPLPSISFHNKKTPPATPESKPPTTDA